MGKGSKSSYTRGAEKASQRSDKIEFYRSEDRGADQFDGRDDDNPKRKRRVDANTLLKQQEDRPVFKQGPAKPRVGPPNKPLLGKRITMIKHRSPDANELLDFILDTISLRYGLYMPMFSSTNGQAAVAMVAEFYGRHNRKLYGPTAWLVAHAYFLKKYVLELVSSVTTIKNIRQRIYETRQFLPEINRVFGPGFIPNNYFFEKVTVDGKEKTVKHFLLRIKYPQLVDAQTGFNLRYGYINDPDFHVRGDVIIEKPKKIVPKKVGVNTKDITKLKKERQKVGTKPKTENQGLKQSKPINNHKKKSVGKEFSSDVTGDGPFLPAEVLNRLIDGYADISTYRIKCDELFRHAPDLFLFVEIYHHTIDFDVVGRDWPTTMDSVLMSNKLFINSEIRRLPRRQQQIDSTQIPLLEWVNRLFRRILDRDPDWFLQFQNGDLQTRMEAIRVMKELCHLVEEQVVTLSNMKIYHPFIETSAVNYCGVMRNYILRLRTQLNGSNGEVTGTDDFWEEIVKILKDATFNEINLGENTLNVANMVRERAVTQLHDTVLKRHVGELERIKHLKTLKRRGTRARVKFRARERKASEKWKQLVKQFRDEANLDLKFFAVDQVRGGGGEPGKQPPRIISGIENMPKPTGRKQVIKKGSDSSSVGGSSVSTVSVASQEPWSDKIWIEKRIISVKDYSRSFPVVEYNRPIGTVNVAPPPKSEKLFKTVVVESPNFIRSLDEYDCFGSPFCGYVCINIALYDAFREKDIQELNASITKNVTKKVDNLDRAYAIGTPDLLKDYCGKRAANIWILSDDLKTLMKFCFDANFNWIIIKFKNYSGNTDHQIGHYILMVKSTAPESGLKCPEVVFSPKPFWFYSMNFRHTPIGRYDNKALRSTDNRAPQHKRDSIELHDDYHIIKEELVFSFNPDMIKMFAFVAALLVSPHLGFINSTILRVSSVVLYYQKLPNEFVLRSREYPISVLNAHSIYPSVQLKKPTDINYLVMLNNKGFSTDMNIDNVLGNTKLYMEYVSDSINNGSKANYISQGPLIQYNTPNSLTMVPEKVTTVVSGLMHTAATLYGAGELDASAYPNHIVKIKRVANPVKVGIPIASAPIGCVWSNGKPISPGMLPVTDQVGIIAAFAGRSMSKKMVVDNQTLNEFCNFFKTFYRPFIDEVDLTDIQEQDDVEFFRQHYTGKRSKLWIDGMVADYMGYLDGTGSLNDSNSCFVKLENSTKEYPEGFYPKPRLIMVMSPVLLFQYCQFLKVVDKWNEGKIRQYQVKHETIEEMVRKISEIQDQPHSVTDYSSFECSIISRVRECENWLILTLLKKSGLTRATRTYEERIANGRYLRSSGVKMFINSRCSGDFHTSFGNGVINIALAMFCANKKLGKLVPMIAEGDDGSIKKGIMDPEITNQIGFSFSEDICGFYPGDTDFLQRRWINGKIYLNIGKTMSCFWVKNKAHLNIQKQMFILRCMGSSLHHMSPGHPVIKAMVNRIGRMTSSYRKPFSTWYLHINLYEFAYVDVDNYPKHVLVDEDMRLPIAQGAIGFPPIPIPIQEELERIIEFDPHMEIDRALSHYPQIVAYLASGNLDNSLDDKMNPSLRSIIRTIDKIGRKAKPFNLSVKSNPERDDGLIGLCPTALHSATSGQPPD